MKNRNKHGKDIFTVYSLLIQILKTLSLIQKFAKHNFKGQI